MENQDQLIKMEIHSDSQIYIERTEREKPKVKEIIKKKLKKNCSCSLHKVKNIITGFFPVLQWLPKYNIKKWIVGDAISGLLVAVVLVPQSIAYSLLAGLEPISSLYTSFFANTVYFLMGTSRHISVGIFSLMCLMVGQVVDRELQLAGFDVSEDSKKLPRVLASGEKWNASVNSAVRNITFLGPLNIECDEKCYAASIAVALTFMAGVYQVLMGVFNLGIVSKYLSQPLLDGFATGASITILTTQVKYLVGLKIPRSHGPGTVILTWINIFKNIHQTNICDLITTAVCLPVLITVKELGDRYKHKIKFPLPTEMVAVIVATIISHYANLNEKYGSSITGEIPTGFLTPQIPNWSLFSRVAIDAVSIAIMSFTFTISICEMFAKKHGYNIKANQEIFALGFCNIVPSFFHSFASSGTLVKTLIKESSGCQTQLSSIITAMIVLLMLLSLAPLLYSLQKSVLACIIIVSLRGAFRKFRDVPKQWQISKIDTLVWGVTMLSVALLTTELGLLIGIVFSLLCIIARTQLPRTPLLGQIQGTSLYKDETEYKNLSFIPRIKIFRFEAPLYYANKDFFLNALYKKVDLNPVLVAAKCKKAEKQQNVPKKGRKEKEEFSGNMQENDITNERFVYKSYDFHTIILECSTIQFLDTAGINTMKSVLKDYNEIGIRVLLANCNPSVIDSLSRGEYFGASSKGIDTLMFYSVHSAVRYAEAAWSVSADSSI
ncbi:sulfate anion transporter 1 [Callorhinchus milii]|uniref:Sulfate transporter n=1 Tax=Callorhinchus milii TaxID=7868 RepID=V9K9N5_CALMI|nr:sulfate anion transporter 1 [Callorhinchus milii]XP_007905889.1 sulfate anion transporter 1 [Callorhinchus milii]BAT18317.2 solute carrier family 26 (sulfate transporter), member 1 [Callorhinchus milii]|eukprot:gi/632978393/ref/XP_007905888.1/ PREDICTED: sulfate anion transporter 1 [Callorhinchus milii]